ncbi:hypothetical protein AB1Y20_007312 [Prymnesium parvum]|uniref:Uncharacterized protein n=1 Tax=Prymnesium parvum TaxID=97485 RepID=A0AB34IWW2_PRYPA
MLGLALGAAAAVRGDAMALLKRTQHNGQRTAWSELPHDLSPRFGVPRIVQLHGVPHDLPADEPFKIAFALHSMEAMTSWISVATGDGRYLSSLELSLTAAGGEVRGIEWSGEYSDEADAEPPAHIELRFVWDSEQESDVGVALSLLCCCCCCLLIYLCVVEYAQAEDRRREQEMAERKARPVDGVARHLSGMHRFRADERAYAKSH